jgi:hypothetical protein
MTHDTRVYVSLLYLLSLYIMSTFQGHIHFFDIKSSLPGQLLRPSDWTQADNLQGTNNHGLPTP